MRSRLLSVLCLATLLCAQNPEIVLKSYDKPVRGTVLLEATVEGQISKISFLKDSSLIGEAEFNGKVWTCPWDTTKDDDGSHDIVYIADHAGGQEIGDPTQIVVDNTPPICINKPFLQKTRNELTLQVEAGDALSGVAFVEFSVDGAKIGNGEFRSNVYACDWTASDKNDYNVSIKISDKAGNTQSLSQKITLDREAPQLEILKPSPKGVVGTPVVCEVKAIDASGIKEVKFQIEGQPQAQFSVSNEKDIWKMSWAPENDGNYTISVKAVDTFFNETQQSVQLQADVNAPKIEWITEHQGRVFTNQSFLLEIKVTDSSPIEEVVLINGEERRPFVSGKDNKWFINWAPERQGAYHVSIESIDALKNKSNTPQFTAIYDKTSPTGEWSLPSKVSNWSQPPFNVKVITNDDMAGIQRVDFLLDGEKVKNVSELSDGWQAEIRDVKNGDHTLRATVYDNAGNQTTLELINIKVDIISPEIKVTPLSKTTISESGTIKLFAVDHDSGIEEVQILCGDRLLKTVTANTKEQFVEFSVADIHEGRYSIQAVALDGAGNRGVSELITFLVDRTPPVIIKQKVTPERLQLGKVQAIINFTDQPSGVDTKISPKVYMVMADKQYPLNIDLFSSIECRASIEIDTSHQGDGGEIFMEGLTDNAGYSIEKTSIGKFTIKQDPTSGWPVLPRNQAHITLDFRDKSLPSRSQGIWIVEKAEAEVVSVESGKIVEISYSSMNSPGFVKVKRLRGDLVWGYHNILPSKNPKTERYWALGDLVTEGDVLGKVAQLGGLEESYLFFELVTWQNQWQDVESPLKYLQPEATKTVGKFQIEEEIYKKYSSSLVDSQNQQVANGDPRDTTVVMERSGNTDKLTIGYFIIAAIAGLCMWLLSLKDKPLV